MSDYDSTNSGILGRNERKDGSGRFFRLTVKPKDGAAAAPRQSAAKADFDNDISF